MMIRVDPPENTLYAAALALNITLAADPDGSLNFGLLIEATPPLGNIRVQLCREQVAGLRERLNELGALTTSEVAELMNQLRNDHPTTD